MKFWRKVICLFGVVMVAIMSLVVSVGAATIYDDLLSSGYPEGTNAFVAYRTRRGDLYAGFYDNVPASFTFDSSGKPLTVSTVHVYFYNNGTWTSYSSGVSVLSDVVYATEDILNKDGTVFFRGAPKPPMVTEGQLSPLMTIIVGLIPLLLPLLVGWISLRKAWTWLRMQLVGA